MLFAKEEHRSTSALRKLKRWVMNPTRFQRQNMHASCKLMSPRDKVWNHLYRKITKITSQVKHTVQWPITMWFTSLFRCFERRKFLMRKQQWTRNGRSSRRFRAWQLEKVKSKTDVVLETQKDKKKVHFDTLMDICHLKNAELESVDWVYSKTQILHSTIRTQIQPRGESYVSLEVEHSSPVIGCARNKRQYLTVLQNQKLIRWMLVQGWTGCLLLP